MSDAPNYYEDRVKKGKRALREIDKEKVEIISRMTPGERLEASSRLYRMAWEQKERNTRATHPDWPEEQVQSAVRELFLYGDDSEFEGSMYMADFGLLPNGEQRKS